MAAEISYEEQMTPHLLADESFIINTPPSLKLPREKR
jgi:hypothetical protein